MFTVIHASFKRNWTVSRRVFPLTFFVANIVSGVFIIFNAYFYNEYFFQGALDQEFQVYTGTSDYISYVMKNGIFYTLCVSTLLGVGRSFINELRQGTLETFLLTPSSRVAYLIGIFTEQVLRSSIEVLIILSLGYMLGGDLSQIKLVNWIVILFASLCSFFCMGICLCAIMLYLRETYLIQNTLFIIMFLLCGVMNPIQYLPDFLECISYIFPLTHVLRLSNFDSNNLTNDLFNLSLSSIIWFGIGIISLKKIERKIFTLHSG
ncbi:ABC transporter permease [Paenibacillus sp. NPDC058177]|uniref:ABC transporter permease n=1 Tax=Paenibacillus sp. NPDC058177 TaxID=3346369 RepID=UPI0036D91D01